MEFLKIIFIVLVVMALFVNIFAFVAEKVMKNRIAQIEKMKKEED